MNLDYTITYKRRDVRDNYRIRGFLGNKQYSFVFRPGPYNDVLYIARGDCKIQSNTYNIPNNWTGFEVRTGNRFEFVPFILKNLDERLTKILTSFFEGINNKKNQFDTEPNHIFK